MLDGKKFASHNSEDSCWIAVHGRAYDVTEFLPSHPGGANIILRCGGQDATDEYERIHPPELIEETLPSSAFLGQVDLSTVSKVKKVNKGVAAVGLRKNIAITPASMINVDDFEVAAERIMEPSTWAYFASAADDEISKAENRRAFRKVALRPRILRKVDVIDTRSKILGIPTSMPVFVSPCGLNKLAHPEGECAISAAVGMDGLIQVVSTGSSMSIESIMEARANKDQPIFYQLYVNKDVSKTKALLQRIVKAGVSAIWLTVDSPILGKRERDDRLKVQEMEGESEISGGTQKDAPGGIAKSSAGWITSSLQWEDLKWIQKATSLPLVLKGIQTVEDAILAYEAGVDGIVLSNHGGRSQDTSQPALLTLLEIRKYAPHLIHSKMEIYLDGGIRRGTDIVKAIALGATAVGLGRPFLHALAVGGQAGVRKLTAIIREELRSNMGLAGAINVGEIVPEMVNSRRLERVLISSAKL